MTAAELDRALRQVLAELDLVSSGTTARLNSSGGGESTGLPATGGSAADPFRRRLDGIDRGHQRRVDGAEATGDTEQRAREIAKAGEWRHDARRGVLTAARTEHKLLTGRTGEAPRKRQAQLDTERGVVDVIREEVERRARPADELAMELSVSKFVVRRTYIALGRDVHDGTPLGGDGGDWQDEARRLSERGLSVRQIAMVLESRGRGKLWASQVQRAIKRAA